MRVGIFGGTFNPVHNGHVVIAILSIEYLGLDKLFIVPTFNPPHRSKEELAPFDFRFSWLKRVFENINKIEVSDYEREKGGISYSIETVRYFRAMYGTKPFFIIGEDSALYFEKWYKHEMLMEEAQFAVYPRFRESKFKEIKRRFPGFILMDLPLIEISSTVIRERAKMGKSIRGMVPTSIEREVLEVYG